MYWTAVAVATFVLCLVFIGKWYVRVLHKGLDALIGNSLDFLDDTAWPWKSWDLNHPNVILNSDHPLEVLIPASFPREQLPALSIPLVWPSHIPAPRRQCGKSRLAVWWIAKHHAPMVDFHNALLLYTPDGFEVEVRANMISEYCTYASPAKYCTQDSRLLAIMRADHVLSHISAVQCREGRPQWRGMLELHSEFQAVKQEFHAAFRHLNAEVDIFACGHPLFWCQLFDQLSVPLPGIMDAQHQIFVPPYLHESWSKQFVDMFFGERRNLMVAGGVYQAFAANWLLGIRIPYAIKAVLELRTSSRVREAEYKKSDLLGTSNVLFHNLLIQNVASALTDYPLSLLRWPQDVACGGNCPKDELAKYRAVVLWPYDTANFKLSEFYALRVPILVHRQLWRTTLTWGYADPACAGGPEASQWKRGPLDDETADSWAELVACDPWEAMASEAGPLPFTPVPDRRMIHPSGATFWARFTDWSLLPHVQRYSSLPDLTLQLLVFDQLAVSRAMDAAALRLSHQAGEFWIRVAQTLARPDAAGSAWSLGGGFLDRKMGKQSAISMPGRKEEGSSCCWGFCFRCLSKAAPTVWSAIESQTARLLMLPSWLELSGNYRNPEPRVRIVGLAGSAQEMHLTRTPEVSQFAMLRVSGAFLDAQGSTVNLPRSFYMNNRAPRLTVQVLGSVSAAQSQAAPHLMPACMNQQHPGAHREMCLPTGQGGVEAVPHKVVASLKGVQQQTWYFSSQPAFYGSDDYNDGGDP
ncbi:unnamed protein product [Polarella glacialis]|uniref:Uncharacterized protein n=1 Tax=Polarella glacialis TaxID=89957 RepID=A0A813JFE8_POLGL|nr:unnamed protein product [Polarella glacialis]